MIDLPQSGHEPVLLEEVLTLLIPNSEISSPLTIVDCTLGRAGHSRAIAHRLSPQSLLIGIDADPRNLSFAAEQLKSAPCTVRLFHANFSQIAEVLREAKIPRVDGILADLGISTNQLFDPSYGMSFDRPMPLDMRLDPDLPENAADLVNRLPEDQLANVLYELAQERWSRRIARKIVEARRVCPIKDTEALAELVRSAIPRRGGAPERIDPATRTFLALRMAVNGEMNNLARLLKDAPGLLASHARMAVISFQSMEDRAVKQAFRSMEQTGVGKLVTHKPVSPSETEIARNPRSRSAKMRVIEKV
jgi:16S rRNA (cytosine1402-N4)-methyltransferase